MANTPKLGKLIRNSLLLVTALVAVLYSLSAWNRLEYSEYLEQRNEYLYDYNHYISSIEDVLLNEGFSEDGIFTLNFYASTTLEKMIEADEGLSELTVDADLLRLRNDNLRSDGEALVMHTELQKYIEQNGRIYIQINEVSAFRACVADINLSSISSTVASASINSCLGDFATEDIDQAYLLAYATDLNDYWSLTSELYRKDGTTENVNALTERVKSAQADLENSQAKWEANRASVLNIELVKDILIIQ